MTDSVVESSVDSRPQIVDEDQMLVSAAQQDPQAAGRLYDKYYGDIFGYIYHNTLDSAATEDLTSNVFLAAFRHLGRYRWRQIPFRAWLYRIATNEIRMQQRRHKRDRMARPDLVDRQRGELCCGIGVAEGSAPAADASPAAAEEFRLLHQALAELRWKYRTVIVLRYFEGKTIEEISGITGQKEGTVKSQLHRGLAQLQEILADAGVLPES